jgi:hypothetical protein
MLNDQELFEKAHAVGLTHREILTALEFRSEKQLKQIIDEAEYKGLYLQFFIVLNEEIQKEEFFFRFIKRPAS